MQLERREHHFQAPSRASSRPPMHPVHACHSHRAITSPPRSLLTLHCSFCGVSGISYSSNGFSGLLLQPKDPSWAGDRPSCRHHRQRLSPRCATMPHRSRNKTPLTDRRPECRSLPHSSPSCDAGASSPCRQAMAHRLHRRRRLCPSTCNPQRGSNRLCRLPP
jgi:hypothetical protein